MQGGILRKRVFFIGTSHQWKIEEHSRTVDFGIIK